MRAIGRDPLFVASAARRRAHRRRRQHLRRLRLLLGPARPRPRAPRSSPRSPPRPRDGTTFGAPTEGEVELAEEVARRMPGVEMLRMTSSGTEASMSAIRLARAATGREKLLKFAGAYHGHVDGLLAEAGSRAWPRRAIPAQPGRPRGARPRHVIVPWNDADAVVERGRGSTSSRRSSPSRIRPTWASSRRSDGFLELLRERGRRQRRAARLRRGHLRLPRRAAAAPRSSPGVTARPHDPGQGHRRRPARRRLRRLARADGADRARRRRLPGGNAEREPARGRRRPGDAGAARRRRLRAADRDDRRPGRRHARDAAGDARCRSSGAAGC